MDIMDDSEEIQFLLSVGYDRISNQSGVVCYGLNPFDNNFIHHYHHDNRFTIGGIGDYSFVEILSWFKLSNDYKLWKRKRVIKKTLGND